MTDLEVLPVTITERQHNNSQHEHEIYKPPLSFNRSRYAARSVFTRFRIFFHPNLPRPPFCSGLILIGFADAGLVRTFRLVSKVIKIDDGHLSELTGLRKRLSWAAP